MGLEGGSHNHEIENNEIKPDKIEKPGHISEEHKKNGEELDNNSAISGENGTGAQDASGSGRRRRRHQDVSAPPDNKISGNEESEKLDRQNTIGADASEADETKQHSRHKGVSETPQKDASDLDNNNKIQDENSEGAESKTKKDEVGNKQHPPENEFIPANAEVSKEIDPDKVKELQNTPKGERPDPEDYLSKQYIDDHLEEFNNGGSFLIPKETYNKLEFDEKDSFGYDDGSQYMIPKGKMDEILSDPGEYNENIEKALGLPPGSYADGFYRVDVSDPKDFELGIPSGNEQGTNSKWIPGGRTSGDLPEAATHINIPKESAEVAFHPAESSIEEQNDTSEASDYPANSRLQTSEGWIRTDDNGKPYMHYDKEAGQWELDPNTEYTSNGYDYTTDRKGRINHVEGDLRLKDGDRAPLNAKLEDMKDGDDRGHIIGDQFDGSNKIDNLMPQLSNVNRGEFKAHEGQLAKALEEGKQVHVSYDLSYGDGSKRPEGLIADFTVDGVRSVRIFEN